MQADLTIAEELEAEAELKIRRVLVVGSGGREYAIVAKVAANANIERIFVAPGNGGTQSHDSRCSNVSIAVENVSALVDFARREHVDLVIVGPEHPLVEGLVDAMDDVGIPCFGPTKAASVAEASKAWSKDFMARNNIQTARYQTFTNFASAKQYIERLNYRVVVKASGLAAGKGVLIPLTTAEAIEGAKSILHGSFGEAGREIVVEEFLEGEEVSILAFCDGFTAKGMPPAQDHKRVFDNDQGLNTGGMGAYAPTPLITQSQYQQCMTIVQQSVTAMAKEGIPFKGVIYAGFIITKNGPYVLEYNCRFGDPETQVLLPLLETDLCEVAMACVQGSLSSLDIKWKDSVACTVVMAAPGYPESYPKGAVISGLADVTNAAVYHAGTKTASDSSIVTNGGRVLAVTGVGKSLQEAVDLSYAAIGRISFDGAHYRRDIARRGLNRPLRIGVIGSTRGSSLQPVIDAIVAGQLSATISLIISNKSNAGILERARNHGIPSRFIGALNKSREEYDALVCDALDAAGVDIVLMIGYMRIVSPVFVQRFPMRCFNVHPSLLPDFACGMDLEVHKAVLDAGRTKSGCTVHFVTEGVDEGPVAVQLECPVIAGDTPESLKAKVQPLEGKALIRAIELYTNRAYPHQAGKSGVEVITYRAAGVDIDAGEALVDRIKPFCKSTVRTGCDAELGGFGGLFDLAQAGFVADDTILVSGTDGVGTKLKIAQAIGSHKTIGIDLVAMCVNDILVCGAEPLFFLDYYATGALNVDEAADVVEGIAEGCRQAGCALIGGETAEMAGMYAKGEYDIAGFSVGAVRRSEILPRGVGQGDVLLGLLSTGVHSNGYSLVRKCVERAGCKWSDAAPFAPGQTLGDTLLTPTRIYIKALLPLIRKGLVKGMAHITGGGLLDNLPRILPPDVCAVVDMVNSGWELSPVFKWLQSIANLPQDELLRTFNNGIGMVVVVSADKVEEVTNLFLAGGEQKVLRLGALYHKADPVLATLEITTSNDDVRVMGTLK